MAMRCTICSREDRAEVDAAIMGGKPLRDIARRHGTTKDAVNRHAKAHIPAKLARVAEIVEATEATTLFEKIRQLEADSRRLLAKAEAEGDLRAAVAATKTALDVVALYARVASVDGSESSAASSATLLRHAARLAGDRGRS